MDVIKRITQALREEYPAGQYDVYTESIEQGFTEPCFSIRLLSEAAQRYPSDRTLYTPHYDVRFFPPPRRKKEQCRKAAQTLAFLLRDLPGLHGTDMEWEITDDVLHFFVSYPHFVREVKQQDAMEELQTEVTT